MKTKNNTQPAPSAEPLWDANDVAEYLKASRSWVYQRATAGLIPCVKLGGLLRFVPSVIRAWALEPQSPSS